MIRRFEVDLPDFAHRLAWSPDGERLGAATLAGPVVILDGRTGEEIASTPGHEGGALSLAWSPDQGLLATGGQDSEVEILDAKSLRRVARLPAGTGWVSDVVWSPRGDVLAAACGRSVRFWSREGAEIGSSDFHASTVSALFHHPATSWVSACYGGLFVIEPGAAAPKRRYSYRGSVLAAAPSPDGAWVALGNQDASVRLWDVPRGSDVHLTGYPQKVSALAWGEIGPTLATGGGNTVVLWGCGGRGPRGTAPLKLEGHRGRITGLAFLDRGARLASCAEDGRLRIWAGEAGFKLAEEDETSVELHGIAVDPVRRTIAAQGRGGRVIVWEI